ncbi:hypothetical protein C0993_008966 [Termitomyces sp. T159_Od127]|nr:hypothetical protein C0993_008966 [Termitomyces sp. T159_Od127]
MSRGADILPSSQRFTEIFRALPFNTTSLFQITNLCEPSDTTGQLEKYFRELQDDEKWWHNPNTPFAIFTAAMKGETLAGQKEGPAVAFSTLMCYRIIDTALFKDGNAHLCVPIIRRNLAGKKIPAFTRLVRYA